MVFIPILETLLILQGNNLDNLQNLDNILLFLQLFTCGFHQTRATNYANLFVCIRFVLFFCYFVSLKKSIFERKKQMLMNVNECNECNECNEKTTTGTIN